MSTRDGAKDRKGGFHGFKKNYTAKGEGHSGFSKAESHPGRFRKMEGSPKDVGAGANANVMDTSSNLPPSFDDFGDAARSAATQD